ncbi:MAG TPA: hypothetical protein VMV92_16685 [Streptosporangiaceae bacterium]|nr:hypothetical protein [Streptosporangiaceae bacterium]
MSERWETTEEIAAANRRFAAAIPGWGAPAAYGIARLNRDRVDFARINIGDHPLPTLVLATVCGHRAESASYQLDVTDLGRAIELPTPAEACTAYDHPNLAAWRWLHAGLGEGGTALAVFVGDLSEPCDDRHAEALRELALAGRAADPKGMAG